MSKLLEVSCVLIFSVHRQLLLLVHVVIIGKCLAVITCKILYLHDVNERIGRSFGAKSYTERDGSVLAPTTVRP